MAEIDINDTKGIQVSGNAIFNWGDQAPMVKGIIEDVLSGSNIIANNNINYYTGNGVVSHGKGTIVENNLGVIDA